MKGNSNHKKRRNSVRTHDRMFTTNVNIKTIIGSDRVCYWWILVARCGKGCNDIFGNL
jgi:hypothetical protein